MEQGGPCPSVSSIGSPPGEGFVGFKSGSSNALEPGWYNASYQQFKTICKLRAGLSNIYMASVDGVSSLHTVGGDKVKHHLTHYPCNPNGLRCSHRDACSAWRRMFARTG